MQKKLIAVAVGGALGAIGASAQAQNATVQVFGTFYGEYASIDNGAKSAPGVAPFTDGYQRYDHFQNPGSEIGFRGEEKLGGGMSAWFQCTSSIDYRGSGNASNASSQAGSTWCTRNSALGMKGAFGNAFFGNWQTPWTRINNAGNVGSNDTGVFGNAHIIAGSSSTFGMASASQAINTVNPGAYRRRQNNLATYETPNLSGFTGMIAATTRNHDSAATQTQIKSRLWSFGAQYANGPLFVGAAYEKHGNFYAVPVGGSTIGGDDKAWTLAANYKFANNLQLGMSYQQFKSNASLPVVGATGGETKVNTWHIGMDWMISGPHGVRAAYSRAGDVKGAFTTAVPTVANPTGVTGTAMDRRPAAGPDTGAAMWQIRYVYAMSKRTELTVGYSRTDNKANAIYETGGASTTQFKGLDSSAYAVAVKHSF